MTTSSSLPRKSGEFLHHPLVDRPLERDDELGQILHRLPAPLDEFRLVTGGRVRGLTGALLGGAAGAIIGNNTGSGNAGNAIGAGVEGTGSDGGASSAGFSSLFCGCGCGFDSFGLTASLGKTATSNATCACAAKRLKVSTALRLITANTCSANTIR